QQVELAGALDESGELGRRQAAYDQKRRIGAESSRRQELALVDDELLAQNRQSRGPARLCQMLEAAVEKAAVAEHAQHVGTGARVALRARAHAECAGELTGGRRAQLDLGDQSERLARGALQADRT